MLYSILPPVMAIVGATLTKRVIPSLFIGLLAGTLVQSKTMLGALYTAAGYLAKIVGNPDNAYIILFLFCFGALTEMFKLGGGISGLAKGVEKHVKRERDVLLVVWLTSLITFMDCCFHVIATGTISQPLLEKVKGTKGRLATVINVTSSQLIVLIPFATTYVGYILGILAASMRKYEVGGNPYNLYLQSFLLNFYSLAMVAVGLLLIWKPFRLFHFRNEKWVKSAQEVSEHSGHEGHEEGEFDEKIPPRFVNLLLPLLFLLAAIVYLFWWTGSEGGDSFWRRFLHADFENAIFVATLAALIFTVVLYAVQKIPMQKLERSFINGGMEMLPPIIVLILAWSIADVTNDLGFAAFIRSLIPSRFPSQVVPLIVFLIGAGTSYFMGSSWGTWALMMPLAFSLAAGTGASIPLTVGAVLGGGSIGDNVSPLGETPVLTASVLKIPLAEHINEILPYGMASAAFAGVMYLILGFVLP